MSEPEESKEGTESPEKKNREFIRETIEEKKPSKKRRVQTALLILVLAAAFGLVAAGVFAWFEPRFSSLFETEEESRESVQIPKDSPEPEGGETAEAEETTEAEETAQVLDEEALRESVEEIVEEALAARDSREEEDSIYTQIAADMASALQPGMVTVTSLKASEDIFQQSYVRSEESFGLILTMTGQDILILTETVLLEEAEEVTVTLGNRSRYGASLVSMDTTTGIAVVSIPRSEMGEEDLSYIEPVTLGNSYLCRAGDTVVALGDPMGHVPSVAWGIISYIDTSVQGIDMNFQLLQTDIAGSSQGTGILVNLDGQIVGWITQEYSESDSRNMLAAVSVSDIKSYIEAVSNGQRLARMGVQLQTVTVSIAQEQDLPVGLYVSNCVDGGPAYHAGLQNGDILVAIEGETVESMNNFQNVLMEYEPGDNVTVTVMRSSTNGYVEQDFAVRLEER